MLLRWIKGYVGGIRGYAEDVDSVIELSDSDDYKDWKR